MFKIGDEVRVSDGGWNYSNYSEMVELFELKKYTAKALKNDATAIVTNKSFHSGEVGHLLYAVRDNNGKEHIMSEKGLELVKKTRPMTIEEIFDFWNENGKPILKFKNGGSYHIIREFLISDKELYTSNGRYSAKLISEAYKGFVLSRTNIVPFKVEEK
jgi:hypothetical protein